MGRLRHRLLATLCCTALGAGLGSRPPAGLAAEEDRPVVVGAGNRLSGSVDVVWMGAPDAPFAEGLCEVAGWAGECGLRVTVAPRERLAGGGPRPAMVATPWPVAAADEAAIERYRRGGPGLVVRIASPGSAPVALAGELPDGLRALDVDLAENAEPWRGRGFRVWAERREKGDAYVVTIEGGDLRDAALSCFRHAIRQGGAVRHLPTAFDAVTARALDEHLVLDVRTLLEGAVTMDLLTVEGVVVAESGPLRPIPLATLTGGGADGVTVAEGTIVRLRFAGSGVDDEMRLWLRDLLPDPLERIAVEGLPAAWCDEPVTFRVVSHSRHGAPAAGAAVEATLGPLRATATTDATGAAILAFPPLPAAVNDAAPSPSLPLEIVVRGERSERRLRTDIAVAPRRDLCIVETDRPLYRPGGVVKLRAFVLAPSGRPAQGREVSVEVSDERGRRIAAFAGRSDDFGAAAFELPLARPVLEGEYRVVCRSGDVEAARAFVVESHALPAFEVRVDFAREPVPLGEDAEGTVEVRDWDGAPLSDADVRVAIGAAVTPQTPSLPGDAPRRPFRLPVPRDARSPVDLHVVVSHGGFTVTRQVPVGVTRSDAQHAREPLTVECAASVRPGATLGVAVRCSAGEPIVDVDLVGRGRVLASASAALQDGVARVELPVPPDVAGAAVLRARTRDSAAHSVTRSVMVEAPALRVVVDAPEDSAPGEDADLRVHVFDPEGRGVPALLDVRGVDRAYAAIAPTVEVARPTGKGRGRHALAELPSELAVDDADSAWDRLSRRAHAAAEAPLHRAQQAFGGAPLVTERLPWGAPVRTARVVGGVAAVAAPAAPRPPGRANRRVAVARGPRAPAAAAGGRLPPVELLGARFHRPTPRVDPSDAIEFLPRHQMPDGSFDAARFVEQCSDPPCGGAGPPDWQVHATSLGVLVFLGAGETHQSGVYKTQVRSALRWLCSAQRADGFVGDPQSRNAALGHALATLALAEAYGMTGSRLFHGPAVRALTALVEHQRDDGGFAESGAGTGSLVLATFAALALKSATMAELPVPSGAQDRLRAWFDANTDPGTGAPHLSAEDVEGLPFGNVVPLRTEAACAFMSRLMLEQTPAQTPSMERARTVLFEHPPISQQHEDPFSVYLGTLAAFQAGGDVWKRWSEALKVATVDHQDTGDTCARGSFAPRGTAMGRFLATAFQSLALEVYYRYGRVFGSREGVPGGGGDDPAAAVRRNFPDALVSELALRTDDGGELPLRLRVPDQITTWDLQVGAWDREGRRGRATSSLRASLPLHATLGFPSRLRPGDVVRVPVRVRSALDHDVDCSVAVTRADGLEVDAPPLAPVRVGAGGTAVIPLDCVVTGTTVAVLQVSLRAGEFTDLVEASAEIAPRGASAAAFAQIVPGRPTKVPTDGIENARATLRVTGSALGAATSSLQGLIRRPTGCFEQTSATLHPAVLAWRLLGARADDARIDFLRQGYQRLLTFEAPSGGFSLYPGQRPTAALTALGIDELLDLDGIVAVDRDVLTRAAEFLASHLPDDPAARIEAVGALRRLGLEVDAPPPEDLADPYVAALALTRGLLDGPRAEQALATLRSTAVSRGGGSAFWQSQARAPFTCAAASDVETTAVVVEALARAQREPALVRAGLETLRRALRPDGAWPTTRQTVAALRALAAASDVAAVGEVHIEIAGRETLRA